MSGRVGRVLVARFYEDFSGVSLGTAYVQVIASLNSNVSAVYIENTSGTPVSIAFGPPGSEVEADVSPINNNVEKALVLNAKMPISIKSLSGTISTGKFLICLYN